MLDSDGDGVSSSDTETLGNNIPLIQSRVAAAPAVLVQDFSFHLLLPSNVSALIATCWQEQRGSPASTT